MTLDRPGADFYNNSLMNYFLKLIPVIFGFLVISGAILYPENPEAMVTISESTLNKFLAAVGEIKGNGTFKTLGIDVGYVWKLRDARIDLTAGKAIFSATARVEAGLLNYDTPAQGSVSVRFDGTSNLIFMKVEEAKFEIYVNLFGSKIHISDVNAAQYYQTEFQFPGPQPIQNNLEIKMPDGSVRKILIKTGKQNMWLTDDSIVVTSELIYEPAP